MHLTCTFLSPSEKQKIHEDSLSILFQVGVKFSSSKALKILAEHGASEQLHVLETDFNQTHAAARQQLEQWLTARHNGDAAGAQAAFAAATVAHAQGEQIHASAAKALAAANPHATIAAMIMTGIQPLNVDQYGVAIEVAAWANETAANAATIRSACAISSAVLSSLPWK